MIVDDLPNESYSCQHKTNGDGLYVVRCSIYCNFETGHARRIHTGDVILILSIKRNSGFKISFFSSKHGFGSAVLNGFNPVDYFLKRVNDT